MTQLKPNQKEMNNMGIAKTIGYILAAIIVIPIVCGMVGAFIFGMGEGIENIDNQGIVIKENGGRRGVVCEYLTVIGDSNEVFIANDDIEKITIDGNDNVFLYFDTASPKIIDKGHNNSFYPLPVGESTPIKAVVTPEIAPTPEPAQDPEVKDRITTKFDGQEKHVKCKVLIVPTNGGTIYIENDDIEVISVIGNGNMIAYPSSANPEIRDVGSYNEIWGSIWL